MIGSVKGAALNQLSVHPTYAATHFFAVYAPLTHQKLLSCNVVASSSAVDCSFALMS